MHVGVRLLIAVRSDLCRLEGKVAIAHLDRSSLAAVLQWAVSAVRVSVVGCGSWVAGDHPGCSCLVVEGSRMHFEAVERSGCSFVAVAARSAASYCSHGCSRCTLGSDIHLDFDSLLGSDILLDFDIVGSAAVEDQKNPTHLVVVAAGSFGSVEVDCSLVAVAVAVAEVVAEVCYNLRRSSCWVVAVVPAIVSSLCLPTFAQLVQARRV